MSTMIMEDLPLNFVALAYSCIRLITRGILACRRIRLFREPDGITMHLVGKILVERHRIGDAVRWVTPIRNVDPFARHPKIPWVWIGLSEDLGDYTEDLAPYMVVGNVITPELIHGLYPETEGHAIQYMDPVSFDLTLLPPEGMVIEDVSSRG